MDEVSQKATPGEWQTLFVSKSTEKKTTTHHPTTSKKPKKTNYTV